MEYLTTFSYWQGCFNRHVISYRMSNNSIVKPLFFSAYDKCLQNIQNKQYFNINSLPTTLINLVINRAIRYEVDFSHLLSAISESNLSSLDVSNLVSSQFSLDKSVYEGISRCHNLTDLDLYGFQVDEGGLLKLSSLKKLTYLSFGCIHSMPSFNLNDKFCKSFSQLTSLSLCNVSLCLSILEFLPSLTTLDFSNCEISQNDPIISPPRLRCLSIANQFSSKRTLQDISPLYPTLETLRISLTRIDSLSKFFSHNFSKLTELELINTDVALSQVEDFIPECCPYLKRFIFFEHSIRHSKPANQLPYEFISNFSSPPLIMELIMNHFHHPDVAAILATLKGSINTFFWSKGRMGSRARISPHFLILAHLLFLNPKCEFAARLLRKEIAIHKNLLDLEVICGEDFIIPLLHYLKHGEPDCIEVINYLHIALEGGYVYEERLKSLIAHAIFVESSLLV